MLLGVNSEKLKITGAWDAKFKVGVDHSASSSALYDGCRSSAGY